MSSCWGCLKSIDHEGYCSICIRHLWNQSPPNVLTLNFDFSAFPRIQQDQSSRASISGVQDKLLFNVKRGKVIPTDSGGLYLLKPNPFVQTPSFPQEVAANEHITMQLAKQLFQIEVAHNGILRLESGQWAYLCKRFDRFKNKRYRQEDFCQIAEHTEETHGAHYKYEGSYELIGQLIKKYCPAYSIQLEKFYQQILFNYVVNNGDAHLKNFSVLESIDGDYILSPAYDLICTRLHYPNEAAMALDLFHDFETPSYQKNGFCTQQSFLKFAEVLGLSQSLAQQHIDTFLESYDAIASFIAQSFLSPTAQEQYLNYVADRLKCLSQTHAF